MNLVMDTDALGNLRCRFGHAQDVDFHTFNKLEMRPATPRAQLRDQVHIGTGSAMHSEYRPSRNRTIKNMCQGLRLCALSMNETLIRFP